MRFRTDFDLDQLLDYLTGHYYDDDGLRWAVKDLIKIGARVSSNSLERMKQIRKDMVHYDKFKENSSKKPKITIFRIYLEEIKKGMITEQEALLRMRNYSKSTYSRFKRAIKELD